MKSTKLFTQLIFLNWVFSKLLPLKYIRSRSEKVVHNNQNQAHKSDPHSPSFRLMCQLCNVDKTVWLKKGCFSYRTKTIDRTSFNKLYVTYLNMIKCVLPLTFILLKWKWDDESLRVCTPFLENQSFLCLFHRFFSDLAKPLCLETSGDVKKFIKRPLLWGNCERHLWRSLRNGSAYFFGRSY